MRHVEPFQKPIGWWGHLWRLTLCLLISFGLLGLVEATRRMDGAAEVGESSPTMYLLDFSVGALTYVVVWWRRRFPLTIAVGLALVSSVSVIAAGPATLALVSLATRRRYQEVILAGLATVAAGWLYYLWFSIPTSDPYWIDLAISVAFTVAAIAWGMYVGSRRELLWTLEQRAIRAEAEQSLRMDRARTTERARIAREMHDVLAHRISQVSMHAGAMAFREDLDADALRSSAGLIQQKANEALDDLRGVLGVLRDPDTGEALHQPQPSHEQIAAMVAEAREAGLSVTYEVGLDETEPLPPAVGRTAFRIVQEGLTNARKHAPHTSVTISLTGSAKDGLTVRVSNPIGVVKAQAPGAPGSGLGLIGLAERAELAGGTLEHHDDGRVFILEGWLPWRT